MLSSAQSGGGLPVSRVAQPPFRAPWERLALAVVIAIGACGGTSCAHTPATDWAPSLHRLCSGRVCYRTGPLEAGWRILHEEGAEIGFFSDRLRAVIQSNATCRDDADAASLESLTDHLLIGYTARKLRAEERLQLDGREALHSTLDARLDGVAVVLDLYVMKRNGCIFDLSFVAPPTEFEAGGEDFSRFVAGFADERHPS